MSGLHPVAARIIEERGITDTEAFLSPSYEHRPNAFLMKGMEEAVARILRGIKNKERIAVWSDYDCDGVPGGALMADFFKMIECPAISYIPERSEGYGLNREGIGSLATQGVSLIMTVDCGISAVHEAAYAKECGVDLIITDHHLPGKELPEAVAVLNPHQEDCGYPFKELCGTGVAFKLVEALIKENMDTACPYFPWTEGQEKWLLDLVALATVADMVELSSENRALTHFGLIVLRKGKRKGLAALLEAMRIPRGSVTEDDIAFSIAPKVNAASRMKSPRLALELLTTENEARAKELAKELVRLNDARKLEGARVAKEVKHRLDGLPLSDVIVLGNTEWKPSLLGIAATNIVETYHRTVCLWGKDGDLIKGSCRSDGSVNIVSLMTEAGEAFEEFGGHELSGGFSVKAEAIHSLSDILGKSYISLKTETEVALETRTEPAIRTTLSELTPSLYAALRALAPFGMGNPKPLFLLDNIRLERVLRFGGHKEHARLSLSDGTGRTIDAVSFFVSRTSFRDTLDLTSPGDTVSLTGSFEQSFFGNKKELRLRLENLTLPP